MKYILLIHSGGFLERFGAFGEEEQRRIVAEYVALSEESGQEAFAIAAERWPRDGTPPNPGGWLMTTARNRAIDRLRRDRTLAAKTRLLEVPEASEDEMEETTFRDERLELIFTCCHPALALEAQVAYLARARRSEHGGDRARLPR